MAVIVVDVIEPETSAGTTVAEYAVTEVVEGGSTPTESTLLTGSAVEVVAPGGYVTNVQWGDTFPPAPVEGQIFIRLNA